MEKPLVTVITTTYNLIKADRKKVFEECVKSVHNQTYENIEHLIIDGASTDGTLDFVLEWENSGWIKVFSEQDNGVYDAFNKGIARAKGKYIVFMNSDDAFSNPDGIKLSVEALEKNNADFSFAPAKLFNPEKPHKKRVQKGKIHTVFCRMPLCHQTLFVKTDLLKKVGGFNTDYTIAADYDLLVNLMLTQPKYVRVNEIFVSFRLGGLCDNNSELTNDEFLRILNKLYNSFEDVDLEKTKRIFKTQSMPWNLWKHFVQYFQPKDKLKFFVFNLNKNIFKIFKK